MRIAIVILAATFIAATPAIAADPLLNSVTGAAKDSATEAATDKVKGSLGPTAAPVSPTATLPKVPSAQGIKDQAKQKATDKASESATGAVTNVLGK